MPPAVPLNTIHELLGNDTFLISGPEKWLVNSMGQTTMFPDTLLIYNNKIDKEIRTPAGRYVFKKRDFPSEESKEWWLVDLANNRASASVGTSTILNYLENAIKAGELDVDRLMELAQKYGDLRTQLNVSHVLDKCCNVS